MRSTLTLLATLALAVPAFAQSQGDSMKSAPQSRTYCLGRFLIDLPSDAEIVSQTAEYRWKKIEVKRQLSSESFQAMIAEKEKTLRGTKHEKEPSLLKHISRNDDGNSVVMVFWKEPDSDHLYETEASKWQKGSRFLVRGQVSVDKVPIAIDLANRSLSELRYRDPKEIPAEPGFCVEQGFFAGEPAMPHYEYAYVYFRLKAHPDVVVTATTRMVMKDDHEGLLDRIDRKSKDTGLLELLNRIKVLRRGKHPAGDIPGEDYLQSIPTGETFSTHTFFWESIAQTKNLYAPEISVEFESGKINIGGYSAPSVTDKQAIELFDSIVNSIRVRPVNGPVSAADGGPSAPLAPEPPTANQRLALGTTLPSGSVCPQPGFWQCAQPTVVGGNQRFFAAGETLSSVLVPSKPSILQRLTGKRTNQLAETRWELVSYDGPAPGVSGRT